MALETNECCVCHWILTRKARRERAARQRPADVPHADIPQADVPQADVVQADVPQADVVQADVVQADVPQADVVPAGTHVISDGEEQPKQDDADGQIVVELMAEVTTTLRRVRQQVIDLQNLIEAH
jgi:hypothetical protein